MAGKGLNSKDIMETATKLVEEKGYDNFSLRELAERLHVKPASLYNHIEGVGEINTAVGKNAVSCMNAALTLAAAGKERDEAFLSAARAYRRFALDNPELYKAIIRMPDLKNPELIKASLWSIKPLRTLVSEFGAGTNESVHFMRCFRSALHGFTSLEAAGFMRLNTIPLEDSFETMIHGYLAILKSLSGTGRK